MNENWINLEQASRLTGYTESYLRRMLRNKELAGFKFSERLWMVDRSSAEELAKKPHTNGRPRAKSPQKIGKKSISEKN